MQRILSLFIAALLIGIVIGPSTIHAAFPAPGDYTQAISWNGKTRALIVHVPAMCTTNRRWPLVFSDYNASVSPAFINLRPKSDVAGYIYVTSPDWNSQPAVTVPIYMNTETGDGSFHDDIAYVSAAITYMVANGNVDSNSVFFAGLSWGGLLAYKLSCRLSTQLTAIGVFAGEFAWRNETVYRPMSQTLPAATRPVSVIHFHSIGDPNVACSHFSNANYTDYSSHESTRFWVRFNRCDSIAAVDSSTAPNGTGITVERWKNGVNGTSVELHSSADAMHGWCYDATNELWAFFQSKIPATTATRAPVRKTGAGL